MTEDSGKTRLILAIGLLWLLGSLTALLVFRVPTDEWVKIQLTLVLGFLIAKAGDIFNFYFGTSSGAKTLSAAQAETAKAITVLATGTGSGSPLTNTAAPTGTPDDPVSVVPVEEDPGLASFKALAKKLNKNVTEEEINSAWGEWRANNLDLDLTRK